MLNIIPSPLKTLELLFIVIHACKSSHYNNQCILDVNHRLIVQYREIH